MIEVLNRYLSEMSDAILDHGGTLVAYMGDGIMAVFGAPIVQTDHADRALATAREMLAVRLPRFNELAARERPSEGFRMGIGLNSGHVMSGNVGSERRVEYTAVGDTTNAAARIEALTKGTPHQLLISDMTKEALRAPADDLVLFGEVPDPRPRGDDQAVVVRRDDPNSAAGGLASIEALSVGRSDAGDERRQEQRDEVECLVEQYAKHDVDVDVGLLDRARVGGQQPPVILDQVRDRDQGSDAKDAGVKARPQPDHRWHERQGVGADMRDERPPLDRRAGRAAVLVYRLPFGLQQVVTDVMRDKEDREHLYPRHRQNLPDLAERLPPGGHDDAGQAHLRFDERIVG